MNQAELPLTLVDSYNLGASYCRTLHAKGGVCILVQDGVKFTSLDLTKFCKDKDFEACACKIYLNSKRICIIALYRAPSGNFDMFVKMLDNILKYLYTPILDFIICGDININYLVHSARKSQLEALLKTYNLVSVVNFPTRIQQKSATAIDNIFLDTSKIRNYSISSITNGLSDHDAQSLTLHSIGTCRTSKKSILIRKINECSINDFIYKLSHENWDSVFSSDDVNVAFNSFLDSYLKIVYSSFPLKRVYIKKKKTIIGTP
jgi:hypothetical protein